jgi:hypothetical protein
LVLLAYCFETSTDCYHYFQERVCCISNISIRKFD